MKQTWQRLLKDWELIALSFPQAVALPHQKCCIWVLCPLAMISIYRRYHHFLVVVTTNFTLNSLFLRFHSPPLRRAAELVRGATPSCFRPDSTSSRKLLERVGSS